MALKRKLTKAEHDKLDDVLKAEYKADGDDFVLDVEGGFTITGGGDADALDAMKRARDNERKLKKDALAKVAELESTVEELQDRTKDIPDPKKVKELEKKAALADKMQANARSAKLDAIVSGIANEISTAPKLLTPHLLAKLDVTFDDNGEATVQMKDKDGKLVALDNAALKKEFVDNAEFKPIIKAGNASGAGGPSKTVQGGGAPKTETRTDNPNPNKVDRSALAQRLRDKHPMAEGG